MPSMPGIRMSMSTTSGLVSLASWTASAPVPASPVTSMRVSADQHPQPGAYQRLVVGEHDPDGHRAGAGSGSRAATRKPPPGRGPAVNSPPSRATRSRMPVIP